RPVSRRDHRGLGRATLRIRGAAHTSPDLRVGMHPKTITGRTALLALVLAGCTQATSVPARTAPDARTAQDGAPAAAPADATAALEGALRERIARERAEVAVSFVGLETGRRVSIDGDVVMHAA